MALSVRELRRRGYDPADIAAAQQQQDATRRAGGPFRTLGEILAGIPARPRPSAAPEDLTARQLRRRGRYGQAALLADQEALTESDPGRAVKARAASATLKELARRPERTAYNFFGGNVTVAHDYHDAVRDRLIASGASPAERGVAHMVLAEVIRWLGWQSFECTRSAAEIATRTGLHPAVVSEAVRRLESVGAIGRIKRGRTKVITITPEGVFRGNVNHHAEAVDRYNAEVAAQRP